MAISGCKWLLSAIFSFWLAHAGHSSGDEFRWHPFYVSVTEINHNAKNRILEVSCKMFTNDFETCLEKYAHLKIDLSDPKARAGAEKYIAEYISRHLQLRVDGKPVNLQWVGSEKEAEATWSYFQVNDQVAVKRIDIVNSLLYESFSSQINIMHVSVNGVRKSTKLTNPETDTTFEF
jgi:hypothetical protein